MQPPWTLPCIDDNPHPTPLPHLGKAPGRADERRMRRRRWPPKAHLPVPNPAPRPLLLLSAAPRLAGRGAAAGPLERVSTRGAEADALRRISCAFAPSAVKSTRQPPAGPAACVDHWSSLLHGCIPLQGKVCHSQSFWGDIATGGPHQAGLAARYGKYVVAWKWPHPRMLIRCLKAAERAANMSQQPPETKSRVGAPSRGERAA
jgi:hypothetical protein